MLKRACKVVLSFMMCIPFIFPISATEYTTTTQNDSYVTQYTNEAGEIIRVMNRTATNSLSTMSLDYSHTKELLQAMGMSEGAINNLSAEDLALYARTQWMYSSTVYYKTDADGIVTVVSEDEALAASIAEKQAARGIVGNGEGSLPNDDYMELTVTIADSGAGNGGIRITCDATWKKMPLFRGVDALGACAQNISITENTYSGYYQYNMITRENDVILAEKDYDSSWTSIPQSKFQLDSTTNGDFNGGGITFSLPQDLTRGNVETKYTDFHVHMRYDGHVQQPTLPTYFNVVGSYTHARISLDPNPSLSIDGNGIAGSIGFGPRINVDRRNAYFEAHYLP